MQNYLEKYKNVQIYDVIDNIRNIEVWKWSEISRIMHHASFQVTFIIPNQEEIWTSEKEGAYAVPILSSWCVNWIPINGHLSVLWDSWGSFIQTDTQKRKRVTPENLKLVAPHLEGIYFLDSISFFFWEISFC